MDIQLSISGHLRPSFKFFVLPDPGINNPPLNSACAAGYRMDETFEGTLTEYPYCVHYTQNGAL
jgi:hypothetical protein